MVVSQDHAIIFQHIFHTIDDLFSRSVPCLSYFLLCALMTRKQISMSSQSRLEMGCASEFSYDSITSVPTQHPTSPTGL
jgi:hypothetical protein